MCSHIGIRYRGRFVEEGTIDDIFEDPQHIYTKRLLAAIPDLHPENRDASFEAWQELTREFKEEYDNYFDEDGLAYDLRPISDTHLRSEEHTSELQSRGHIVCRL